MYNNPFDYHTLVGKQFKQFLLKSIIGEGAMGVVFKARDTELHRDVAIKILKKEALNVDSDLIKRFKREAQNIAKLKHENIIDVHSFESCDGFNFIVMEYVDGHKLSDLIKDGIILDYQHSINIIYLICKAVEYSHRRGILHRDIKPANIMISSSGDIKLVDFGLSKSTNIDASKISKHGDIIGTPIYMSLETLENSDVFTEKSDIYSIGVVFYELLTGALPFTGKSTSDLYKHLIIGKYTEVINLNENVNMEINNLINNMLKKDPQLRYDLTYIMNVLHKYINFDSEHDIIKHTDLNKTKIDVSKYPTQIVNNNSVSNILYKKYLKKEKLLILLMIISTITFTSLFLFFVW